MMRFRGPGGSGRVGSLSETGPALPAPHLSWLVAGYALAVPVAVVLLVLWLLRIVAWRGAARLAAPLTVVAVLLTPLAPAEPVYPVAVLLVVLVVTTRLPWPRTPAAAH
ncbi:hypothetical protein E0H26_00510 [Micromonospora zingiberis]|uniref:Uncharacterized protein n=1 Tax=Micromonospora zingiberis TaxID=2053011 RepID=A0A4R0GQY5_9ACTN|nr:hypothetical protein [Micromonospora zingiberis]TCC00225.1 hypothetical protein E0H26_00510 [Micromonospora zingiberis]